MNHETDKRLEPVNFVFGRGETIVHFWYSGGHGYIRLAKALEPQVIGHIEEVAIDEDAADAWLLFEDVEAVDRLGDGLKEFAARVRAKRDEVAFKTSCVVEP